MVHLLLFLSQFSYPLLLVTKLSIFLGLSISFFQLGSYDI